MDVIIDVWKYEKFNRNIVLCVVWGVNFNSGKDVIFLGNLWYGDGGFWIFIDDSFYFVWGI